MKNQSKHLSAPKISNLIFTIQPLQLTFQYPSTQIYFLQFDKGAQTIKKFSQQIVISPVRPRYRFTSPSDIIKLKVNSEHDLSFQWEIYRMTNKVSEFVDSIPVNLEEYYEQYVSSVQRYRADYDRIIEDKNKGRLTIENWSKVKDHLLWEFPQNRGKNMQFDIQLNFSLQIWNEIDIWCELERQKCQTSYAKLSNPTNLNEKKMEDESDELDQFPENLTLEKRSSSNKEDHQQEPKYTPKKKYIAPITMLKRTSVLSQIIQCSNECSSILNYGERHADLQQISRIPEQQQQQSPYINEIKGDTFRRSNTLDSNLYQFPQTLNKWRKVSTPQRQYSQDGDKEDLIGRMETEPQSLVEANAKDSKLVVNKLNARIFIVVMVCLIAFGFLAYSNFSQAKTRKSIKKQAKKPEKAQTPIVNKAKGKVSNRK